MGGRPQGKANSRGGPYARELDPPMIASLPPSPKGPTIAMSRTGQPCEFTATLKLLGSLRLFYSPSERNQEIGRNEFRYMFWMISRAI